MPNIHIVTDSSADFANNHFVEQYAISVLPNRVAFDGSSYRSGIDLSAEEALRLIEAQRKLPRIIPHTQNEYFQVFSSLVRKVDAIISIHPSRYLSESWHNAEAAARELVGHIPIHVIDSGSISAGQAALVRVAAHGAQTAADIDTLVRKVRSAVDRIYSVFYVETIDYLAQTNVMEPSHIILGKMLDIKLILTLDEGILKPIEKVKTRAQAIDRLVEFATEFTDIEEAVILQHKTYMSEQARLLQDRLLAEFPGHYFPYTIYGTALGALLGADAVGLAILESELEEFNDGF